MQSESTSLRQGGVSASAMSESRNCELPIRYPLRLHPSLAPAQEIPRGALAGSPVAPKAFLIPRQDGSCKLTRLALFNLSEVDVGQEY